ncbi:MAG: hypothetical protein QXQ76_00945 [Candidatus Bathyarchaeia archaeon]
MARRRKVGKIPRRPGYLYFVEKDGSVYEVPLKRRGRRKRKR